MDNAIGFPNTYPVYGNLSGGWLCPAFEQPGPKVHKCLGPCLWMTSPISVLRRTLAMFSFALWSQWIWWWWTMFYSIYSTWLYPLLSITILKYIYLWESLSSWPHNGGQQKSNWQTTLSTWLKTNPWVQAPEVCEKTFSTYFIPQPVENTLTYSHIFIKDNQDNQVIRAVTKSRGPGIFPCYYECHRKK